MKKNIKLILLIIGILFGIILLDTIQARIFKNSPFISWKEKLEESDSWVDKGILINTYYCAEEKDIVTVSWHFKNSKFTCSIDNKESEYQDYKKISTLKSNKVDTNTLIRFNGDLYGQSYAIIDFSSSDNIKTPSIGIIDKLIPNEYVPKINGETNKEEVLNALVFDSGNNIVLLYNNEYVLFEKINE